MEDEKSHISVAHGFQVQQPAKGRAFLVPILEWENLKDKIRRIDSIGFGFHTTGSVLLGIAATNFVGALSMPRDFTILGVSSAHICWAITLLCAACGALVIYFARRERKIVNYTKLDVLSDIEQIERKYGKAEQHEAQPS